MLWDPELTAQEIGPPHSDSSWPEAPEEFAEMCEGFGVSDREIDLITHENAMRAYGFDPFAIGRASGAASARCGPRLPAMTSVSAAVSSAAASNRR
jgi:hypothetical protein